MNSHKKLYLLLFFVCLNSLLTFSQDRFSIIGGSKSYSMSFKLINNLIVIPIKVNGSELNFLFDSGVNNTIMFNLSIKDSTQLKSTKKIRIRGLGEGTYIDAIQSKNNFFKLGKIANAYHMIYLIPGKKFDLSANMGVNINGIVGGDLFRDFIVDINYTTKRLKFYKPTEYKYKACKKCQSFDLSFYRNKPYLDIEVQSNNTLIKTKLLIDTGGSKSLWLFDKSSDKIKIPDKYFVDYLGKGLSGNIYGKRSKIDKIILGNYSFTNANVAYPDSASVKTAYRFKERNGSLGSGILKRFRLLIDYRNKKFTIKKKSSYFNEPFVYNMSGIELIHGGRMLVKENVNSLNSSRSGNGESIIEMISRYVYDFKPVYTISQIRKDSPADKAGLLPDDVILQINRKPAYNLKIEEIIHMFSIEEGKRIKLLIGRNGKKLFYSFKLEKVL